MYLSPWFLLGPAFPGQVKNPEELVYLLIYLAGRV